MKVFLGRGNLLLGRTVRHGALLYCHQGVLTVQYGGVSSPHDNSAGDVIATVPHIPHSRIVDGPSPHEHCIICIHKTQHTPVMNTWYTSTPVSTTSQGLIESCREEGMQLPLTLANIK